MENPHTKSTYTDRQKKNTRFLCKIAALVKTSVQVLRSVVSGGQVEFDLVWTAF